MSGFQPVDKELNIEALSVQLQIVRIFIKRNYIYFLYNG